MSENINGGFLYSILLVSDKITNIYKNKNQANIRPKINKNYLIAPKIVVYYRKLFKITGNNGNFENKALSYAQQS